MWATTLAASVRERLPGLRLAGGHMELVCVDHMCMRFGEVCLCKLSIQLARLQHVRHLDLSGNNLERLPEVWRIRGLESLDVSFNRLGTHGPNLGGCARVAMPPCPDIFAYSLLSQASSATVELPEELSAMPHLRELNVADNPLRSVPEALEPLISRGGRQGAPS
jgi:hypothetical protein